MTETLTLNDCPSLTGAAAKRVRAIADKLGQPARLRLSVDGGGCSGFTYRFDLDNAMDGDDDAVTQTDGVALVVDGTSLDLLRGSVVDFVESLGGSSFKVSNPSAVAGCGCGTSFSV